MTYRVLWTPVAEQQFEHILRHSRFQSEITEAAQAIDTQLISDPFAVGESRYDDVRVCFVRPLGVDRFGRG